MIDLHAHLLPGVDDGPTNWEEALALSRQLAGQGVTKVLATPHFFPGCHPEPRQIVALINELNERLRSIQVPLTVYPGVEVYLDPDLTALVARRAVLTLNNTGRYLLVELPFDTVPSCTENVFFYLMLEGFIPILAHPERNVELNENPGLLVRLVERGVLVQVNAGSIAGEFGSRVQRFAENLVCQGLVHFLGSDAHHPRKRPSLLPAALARLNNLVDRERVLLISHLNPRAILVGGEVRSPVSEPGYRRERPGWTRSFLRLLGR